MQICKKGHALMTASREVNTFVVDGEPYEAGTKVELEIDEIETFVSVGILYCQKCDEVVHAWIEEK